MVGSRPMRKLASRRVTPVRSAARGRLHGGPQGVNRRALPCDAKNPRWLHDITLQTGGYPTLVEDLSLNYAAVLPPTIPEPSTWAMMLLGFAGLGFAGYRRVKSGRTAFSAA